MTERPWKQINTSPLLSGVNDRADFILWLRDVGESVRKCVHADMHKQAAILYRLYSTVSFSVYDVHSLYNSMSSYPIC